MNPCAGGKEGAYRAGRLDIGRRVRAPPHPTLGYLPTLEQKHLSQDIFLAVVACGCALGHNLGVPDPLRTNDD